MQTDVKTILVVEDDVRLAILIKEYLEQQGYRILMEHRGDTAADRIKHEQPDMLILDLMLPGMDGLTVLRQSRPDFTGPVLILTAKEDDSDQIYGLELGADDYIKKPVDPAVLLARIRALFRRIESIADSAAAPSAGSVAGSTAGGNSGQDILRFGGLEIHIGSRHATFFDQVVDLSTLEFDLLALLASEPGIVMDRDRLCRTVRGVEYDGLDRSIDVAISRLRKKLEDNPEKPFRIKTIWGSGYLFAGDAWEKEILKDNAQKKFFLE